MSALPPEIEHALDLEALEEAQGDAADALAHLAYIVRRLCPSAPGDHQPLRHFDGLPAWCPHCGRDDTGIERRRV
jgi:hypothetical protein